MLVTIFHQFRISLFINAENNNSVSNFYFNYSCWKVVIPDFCFKVMPNSIPIKIFSPFTYTRNTSPMQIVMFILIAYRSNINYSGFMFFLSWKLLMFNVNWLWMLTCIILFYSRRICRNLLTVNLIICKVQKEQLCYSKGIEFQYYLVNLGCFLLVPFFLLYSLFIIIHFADN